MPVTISSIKGERILDSRGTPTLLVFVTASDGSTGTFSVPSGASTGVHEAHELRDDGTSKGDVTHAISLLESEIAPALFGMDISAQEAIDAKMIELDGTANKERLGGNTMIGVSVACLKAAASSRGMEVWQYLHDTHFPEKKPSFPRLYANLINGGKHAATPLAFQEYHVVPKTDDPKAAADIVRAVQEALGALIQSEFGDVQTGDEGGYALPASDVRKPLMLLEEASRIAGVRDGVEFALDVAASSFWDADVNSYRIAETAYETSALGDLYRELASAHQLLSIEDPYHEEDFVSFASLRETLPSVLVVGDDLTTTNKERLSRAIESGSISAIIIKPNQIGTLTETIKTMAYADAHGIKCIVSHRSGETDDTFIADLAYASAAFGIKLGARGPKEREAKYARLQAIKSTL